MLTDNISSLKIGKIGSLCHFKIGDLQTLCALDLLIKKNTFVYSGDGQENGERETQ